MSDALLPAASTRRRALWIVLGTIGLVLLSAVAVFLDAWISAGNVLDREKVKVAERTEAFRNLRAVVPNLFEPAEEGNAWDSLEKAYEALRAIPMEDQDVLFPTLAGNEVPVIDDVAIERLLPLLDTTMGRLKRALRCREWEPGRNFSDLFGPFHDSSGATTRFSRSLNDLAAHQHRLKRTQTALEMLAMAFWLQEFSTAKGTLQEEKTRWILDKLHRDTLREILRSHEATGATLAWFAGALDRLEKARLPLVEMLRREDLAIRQVYVKVAREGRMPEYVYRLQDSGRPVDRGILPLRLQVARWLARHESLFQSQVLKAQVEPWQRTHARVNEPDTRSENLFEILSGPLEHAWCRWLDDRQGVALARIAVALAWYEAENGRYPESMGDLVPRHIESIPIDFKDGRPFVYSNRGHFALVDFSGNSGDGMWGVKRREAATK